jgi:hypothetical protein
VNPSPSAIESPAERARFIRQSIPADGLFAGHDWRIAPDPFPLGERLATDLEKLGRVVLQFYRAANLLYRQSFAGKQPGWVASLLDQGKPDDLIARQRDPAFKNDLPRVIRPDLLLTDDGLALSELDSVPGGIGLTAWLNHTYTRAGTTVIGGPDGMLEGFRGIFGKASHVHIVVSEESKTYRPEMQWMAGQLGDDRFQLRDGGFMDFREEDAVYRFFELFDLANVPNASRILDLAAAGTLTVTPPPKMVLEEKSLFALLWNRNLEEFWYRELGKAFFHRMRELVPYTWVVDPAPLPPHAAIPELNLTHWEQLKILSQRERELILKVSGFSPESWGARGVHFGSDLSQTDWSVAVDKAIQGFGTSPYILQRYNKPRTMESTWFDFDKNEMIRMPGRVRLCPYYFVHGEGDAARPRLGGVLATVCPPDKKIIHGMPEAIMAPCSV